MNIAKLQKTCYRIASEKGFHLNDPRGEIWENDSLIPRWLCLIHSEVSEAMEAHRNDDQENFIEEVADVIIRLLDMCGALGQDIEPVILEKCRVNQTRPQKHGKRY